MVRSRTWILTLAMRPPARAPVPSSRADAGAVRDLWQVRVELRECLLRVQVELRVDERRRIECLLDLATRDQIGDRRLDVALDGVFRDPVIVTGLSDGLLHHGR